MNLGGLLFSTLCLMYACTLWLTRPQAAGHQASGVVLAVRSAIPPLLLAWCLVAGAVLMVPPLTDTLRLRVLKLEVNASEPRKAAFTVGGGVAGKMTISPDLLVGLDGNFPDTIFAQADIDAGTPAPALDATLRSRVSGNTVMITSWEGVSGEKRLYAGGHPLGRNAQLCLADCDAGGRWYRFDGSEALIPVAGGAPIILQRRPGLPGWRKPWGPEQAIYPLRTYLGLGKPATGEKRPLCELFACAADPATGTAVPARSFLIEEAGEWQVVLLDPSARLKPANGSGELGDAVGGIAEAKVRAISKDGLRIRVWRADLPAEPCSQIAAESFWERAKAFWPRQMGEGGIICRNGALSERRSFVLRQAVGEQGRPVAVLALDTQEYHPIGTFQQPHVRLVAKGDPDDPDALSLDAIKGGEREGSILSAAIHDYANAFVGYLGRGGAPERSVRGSDDICRAGMFEMCAGNNVQAIRFGIDRMLMPWLLIGFAGAAALAFHAASAQVWRTNGVDSLVFALTQFLLVMRTIVGVEGAFVDHELSWRDIYSESAIAMVALPTILIAVRSARDSRVGTLLAIFIFNIAAYAAAWRWLGTPADIQLVFMAAALGGLTLRLATLLAGEARRAALWNVVCRRAAHVPAFAKRCYACVGGQGLGVVLLVLLAMLRGMSPAFGIKEHVGRISVSVIYLPLLILAFALLIARADGQEPRSRWWAGIWFVLLVFFAVLGAPAAARDNGFGLVAAWPILGVGLWYGLRWRREAAGQNGALPWIVPLPTTFALYALLSLCAYLFVWPAPPVDRDSSPAQIQKRLDHAAEYSSGNWMRLMAVSGPNAVADLGTIDAAKQMEQTIQLVERTDSMFGRGYMRPSIMPTRQTDLGVLHEVHLTDNLSAVHIMAPFGRVAAIAFLAVLAAVAAGSCSVLPTPALARWQTTAGILAIWMIFGAAAYMILANLLLIPFTGRNVYLLASTSGSDLLEGLALLLIARLGLQRSEAA